MNTQIPKSRKSSLYKIIPIIILVIVSLPLRFINLGYSEFQDDEKKSFIRLLPKESTYQFLLKQRKGPMQFLVPSIPYAFTKDYKNEFAERLPFALINTASVVVLYLLLNKLTKNKIASLFGSLLYATNGFIVGFSRISQYQSLNLCFSFLALYFYADIKDRNRNILKSSLFGTVFFCLSLLSHWDAVYYLVPIIYFFSQFLIRREIDPELKKKVIIYNFVLGCVLLLPFLIPYIIYHSGHTESVDYFARRIGFVTTTLASLNRHKFIFELYNPFITLDLYAGLLVLSLLALKKYPVYLLWFVMNFLTILFFMTKPGTHIYNYLIPLYFIFAFMMSWILTKVSIFTKVLFVLAVFFISLAFFYQSYFIFVDHTKEYPWEEKIIFGQTTAPYLDKEVLAFGFPHYRNWKGVNDFMLNDDISCGYLSNEGKEVSQIYLDAKYAKTSGCYYIVTIKRPFIITRDALIFPQLRGKKPVFEYTKNNESLTQVYKIPHTESLSKSKDF